MPYSICLISHKPYQVYFAYEMDKFHTEVFGPNTWLSEFPIFFKMSEFYGADSYNKIEQKEILVLKNEIAIILKKTDQVELRVFCKILQVICDEALENDYFIETCGD